jgi:hypothetical protein
MRSLSRSDPATAEKASSIVRYSGGWTGSPFQAARVNNF